MAKKAKAVDLGFLRGESEGTDLSGLFAASVSAVQQAVPVKIEYLADNPYQPRRLVDPAGLEELAQVIRTQGFQGVLVARPYADKPGWYQLTAGHRRREAARRAGLTTLPLVVRELTDEEMVVLAITENIQREDLNPLEEGKIYLLMAGELGYTHEQIAREIGKNRGYVENRIRVARAPADIQALVLAKPDSLRAVATLVKVRDPARRAEIIRQMQQGSLTADDLPGYIGAQDPAADPAGRRDHPSPGNGAAAPDDQTQARIGNGKLTAAVRTLTTYRDSLQTRQELSVREHSALLQLRAVLDDIWAWAGLDTSGA